MQTARATWLARKARRGFPRRALTVAATSLAIAVSAALAAPAPALAEPVGGPTQVHRYVDTITATGDLGTASVTLPLPPGTRAVEVTGHLTGTGTGRGTVTVTAGDGRVSVPTGTNDPVRVAVPVPVAQALTVTITNAFTTNPQDCVVDTTSTQTLSGLVVTLVGTPTLPRTVAEFFPPSVQVVDVVPATLTGPTAAGDAAGALQLAATLGTLYPTGNTTVRVTSTPTAAGPNARIVTVTTHAENRTTGGKGTTSTTPPAGARVQVTTVSGTPTMALTGTSQQVTAAAVALGHPANVLADQDTAANVSGTTVSTGQVSMSIADLGSTTISLSTHGTARAGVGVNQVTFSPPVSAYTVHLEGTNTPVSGDTLARVSALWNDTLIGSVELTSDDHWTLDAPVSGPDRAGTLTVAVDTASTKGKCGGAPLATRVDVDTTASVVTATRGQGLTPGFARFPQVTYPTVPVTFGTGTPTWDRLDAGAQVLVALARVSSRPLTVTLQPWDTAVKSAAPVFVIGATRRDTDELSAPLRIAPWRSLDQTVGSYTATVDGPYAALEAYDVDGRNLLVLARTDDADALMNELATSINALDYGWASLSNDLYVALPGQDPVTLATAQVVPQDEVADEFRTFPVWLWVVIGLVALAIIANLWMVRRRKTRVDERFNASVVAGQQADVARTGRGLLDDEWYDRDDADAASTGPGDGDVPAPIEPAPEMTPDDVTPPGDTDRTE